MDNIPEDLREFDDTEKTRQLIYDGCLEAVKNRFPVEDDTYRLELSNVRYDGPQDFSLEQQKQALLKSRNLRTPIKGTWKLIHKPSGAVLDERDDTVMQVPYYTDRGTVINNGNEYNVISQMRLRSGVYARKKRTGELESHFNIKPGTGRSFRFELDPKSGVFNLTVGQSHVPLYPILKGIGVSDKDMIQYWGADVTAANAAKSDMQALKRTYSRMAGYNADPNATSEKMGSFIRDTVSKYEVDPEIVSRTMGLENTDHVTPDLMLRASQKLLDINRGDAKPDNRDNPRFTNVFSVEDLFRERIEKDSGKLTKNLMWRAKRDKSLHYVPKNALTPYIDSFLLGSGLTMPGEETNPLSNLEQMTRMTRFGVGGIKSEDAVTEEAHDVNGDWLGFVDFIAGPESGRIGVDVRAAYRTFKGRDHNLYGEFINARNGKTEYIDIGKAADKTIAFPNQDMSKPYVYAVKNDVPTLVPANDIDLIVPSFAHMNGSNINMNPMPTAVQGGRQFYGAKFWAQYLPQVKGEVPLVDSLMPDGKTTFSEYYGRRVGTIRSKVDGTVVGVKDNVITVKDAEGNIHKTELVRDLPFNRLSAISFFPSVEVGQDVKAGDMLAHSNYTDSKTGAINIGQNLKAAIIPYNGNSFEDAHTISESAAKRLATERLYCSEVESRNGVQINRNKYMAAFPQKFTKQQFETLDEDGIVKPGTVLHKGDPITVAIGPKVLSSADAALGKLSKTLRNAYTDRSEVWEHDSEGIVVDAVKTASGSRVNIKSTPPVQVGDKLSPRFGLKGLVGKIIPDDKMPRDVVTNQPYDILMNPMGFLSRVAPGQIMELSLGKVAKATGKQIRIPQTPPPEGWQKWTENQLKQAGVSESADVFDPETGKTIKNVGDGYVFVAAFHHLAEKKASQRGTESAYTQDDQPAKGGSDGAKRMCFTADQTIRVLHGEENIGHIVEKRIPEYVWTRFDDGSWGYSIVTNWFCRKGKMSEVLSISVDGLPGADVCSRKRVVYTDKTMHVTRQHHLFSPDKGEILAGDVKPGDWLTSYGYVPTEDQMSLLIGSMLGDGCICNINDNIHKQHNCETYSMPYYCEQHSHHQYAYANWKIHCLGRLVSSRSNTVHKSKSGFSTHSGERVAYYDIRRHDISETLKNMFYRQEDGSLGRKNLLNVDLDSINDVGIVAWFLDDGCIAEHTRNGVSTNSPSGTISTQCFNEEENIKLATWLKSRLNAEVTVRKNSTTYDGERRTYFYLGLSADACRKMARLVARYVKTEDIPKSKKWLVKEVDKLKDLYTGVNTSYTLGSIPVLVTDVKPYNDGKHGPEDEINLYDITVAKSHKYCASDCLVSNSGLDTYALLAHGATDVIKDYITVRGTRNEDYWNALRLGLPIPEPKVPFIYDKFLNTLRAGGINVVEKGNITKIMPMTDKDIDKLAGTRIITSSAMVDSDFSPVTGGLFDLGKTGGMAGNNWSAIQLPEPVPNPIMEEPVRRVLGLTVKQLEGVLSGTEKLNGKTGGQAIKDALSEIDVDKKIAECRSDIKTKRGSARDNAIKVLGYLNSMKEQELSPSEWMISKVPVLPPKFRPVSKMGNVALVSDLNDLYKEVIENADAFKELHKDLPDEATADERLNIYKSVKAAYGLGESITPEGQAKNLKGAIRQVIGSNPKFGMFQRKVISKTVDTVSRSAVTPDPNLDMDQVGIPEDAAWEMYKPFVMRSLVRHGYPPVTAINMLEQRDKTARSLLEQEMAQRPIMMDRAPTWHKFNIMAFKPHITEGKTVRVCPLVVSGFNMDFDGDTVNFHVPVSQKAVDQALNKMLPSKNLISLTDLKSARHPVSKEQILGLWNMTQPASNKPVKVFRSVEDVKRAYAAGEIGMNDPVEIIG